VDGIVDPSVDASVGASVVAVEVGAGDGSDGNLYLRFSEAHRERLLRRLAWDLLLTLVAGVAATTLQLAGAFAASNDGFPLVLHVVTVLVGACCHYVIPELRTTYPFRWLQAPVIKEKPVTSRNTLFYHRFVIL
jgi:predicted membrane-bound spermidine synthase